VRRGGRRAAGGGAKRPTQWDAPRKKSRAVSVRTSAKEETAKSAGAPAHAHPPCSHPKCAPSSEDAGVGVGACVRGCACARVVGRCGIDPHTSRPRAPEHPPHMIAPSHTRPRHAHTPNARRVARVWVWVRVGGCGSARAAGGGAKRPMQWEALRKRSRAVSVRTSAKAATAKSAGARASARTSAASARTAPEEQMQGVRGGGHLPAPAHQEPMQGVRGDGEAYTHSDTHKHTHTHKNGDGRVAAYGEPW
jgi:hypothetical protein